MATTQGDLAKLVVEAFAMLDKRNGRPTGRGAGSPSPYSHEDLPQPRPLGLEAFAMLDKHYGRPAGTGAGCPSPYSHEGQPQPRAYPEQRVLAGRQPPPHQQASVINSKDAALAFGGIEIREYDQKLFRGRYY